MIFDIAVAYQIDFQNIAISLENKMRMNILLLFISCITWPSVSSYKILGVFHIPAKSHYIVGHALMKGLAEQGHEVTVISAFKSPNPIENYEEIYLEHSIADTQRGNIISSAI